MREWLPLLLLRLTECTRLDVKRQVVMEWGETEKGNNALPAVLSNFESLLPPVGSDWALGYTRLEITASRLILDCTQTRTHALSHLAHHTL